MTTTNATTTPAADRAELLRHLRDLLVRLGAVRPRLSARDRLLSALREAGRPLKGEALARRAGLPYNGGQRSLMGRLVREGLLRSGPDGYLAAAEARQPPPAAPLAPDARGAARLVRECCAAPDAPPARPSLAGKVVAVLAVAAGPLKGEAVARRCGRKYDSHFRAVMARLALAGRLIVGVGGYGLAPPKRPGYFVEADA